MNIATTIAAPPGFRTVGANATKLFGLPAAERAERFAAKAGIAPDALLEPGNRVALAGLGARLGTQAERYEASARGGTPALPFRSAWAVLAAAGIYGDIARAVRARGVGALEERVTTSKAAKLGWIARSLGQAAGRERYAGEARPAGLWTRPR